MCIDNKLLAKDRKEWLKDQPDIITAYKVVEIKHIWGYDGNRLSAFFTDRQTPFKRTNLIREVKKTTKDSKRRDATFYDSYHGQPCEYIAYYHLFPTKKDAQKLTRWNMRNNNSEGHIIKCLVPKKYITDIGEQWGIKVIVTRGFDIIGQDEYLKE